MVIVSSWSVITVCKHRVEKGYSDEDMQVRSNLSVSALSG